MQNRPSPTSELASQLLFGEGVDILEQIEGWSRVRVQCDGYCGWISDIVVRENDAAATHRISQPSGLVFARPDIKAPLVQRLYLGSPLALQQAAGGFYELAGVGYVHTRHIARVKAAGAPDPLAVALQFLNTPYLWGGRTCDGIDCSGLVQAALLACGIGCPRDTGDQRAALADRTVADEPRRGDLVYFPGHVGIMTDGDHLLHANAFWMSTVIEPLSDVVERFRPAVAEPVLAVIRSVQPHPAGA